jgi:hypothetical protein
MLWPRWEVAKVFRRHDPDYWHRHADGSVAILKTVTEEASERN